MGFKNAEVIESRILDTNERNRLRAHHCSVSVIVPRSSIVLKSLEHQVSVAVSSMCLTEARALLMFSRAVTESFLRRLLHIIVLVKGWLGAPIIDTLAHLPPPQ